MRMFSTGQDQDWAMTAWVAVLVAWAVATIANWVAGNWIIADIPSGVAAVLVAVPVSKGVARGLREFGKGP
jgi:hypothetical protein